MVCSAFNELFENFEQWALDETRLELDVRLFRATGLGGGTIRVRCTIISNNRAWKRHDQKQMYDNFEQQGLEEARCEADVR
ncbi:hypothetical protein [Cohnella abietis]|uniref:hypothetical protein n=1 Tax=Cohnella abietis TaxID=2507935 RepID=UPI00102E2B36|nr:hypothetical protein [Cohnella abietis]